MIFKRSMFLLPMLFPIAALAQSPVIPTPGAVSSEQKAPEGKDKKTIANLRGSYAPGQGFRLFFGEGEDTFINLSGYVRLTYSLKHTEIDEKKAQASADPEVAKLKSVTTADPSISLPYFRYLLDLQMSKEWAVHSRLDYNGTFFMAGKSTLKDGNKGKELDAYTVPGVYFARAYITWKPIDELSLDIGRNLFDPQRGTSLVSHTYSVSNGLLATYKTSLSKSLLGVTMVGKDARLDKEAPALGTVFLIARQEVDIALMDRTSLKLGAGYLTGKTKGQQLHRIVPGAYLTLADLYINEEMSYEKQGDNKKLENYTEIGYAVNSYLAPDIYYRHNTENTIVQGSEFGLEFVIYPLGAKDQSKYFILSLSADVVDPEKINQKNLGSTLMFEWDFI